MGNKQVNDCCGPELSEKETKELSFTGFTLEELRSMGITEDEKNKFKTKKNKLNNKKKYIVHEKYTPPPSM
tara:strand:+ start:159 stop:371 length:213 start_codon:yes stop_codon:yes gene_type:complete